MPRAALRLGSCLSALAVLFLTACSSGNANTSGGKINPPPPISPYVATSVLLLTQNAINTYPLSGDGTPTTIDVTPSSTLTAPSGTVFTAMAQDTAGNLYVGAYQPANIFSQEILVYPTGSSGAATPSRIITGAATQLTTKGLSLPQDQLYGILALAVDTNGQVYATIGPSILAFAPTASGNVAPTRIIAGSSTGITYVTTLAVDSANNILATNVDSSLSIGEALDFNAAADGNVAPAHTYAGTEMSFAFGLDVDSNNNVYVSDTTGGGKIYVYTPTGSSPMRTFTTAASSTGGSYESFWSLRQDSSGYTFVAVQLLTSGMTGIQVFSPSATGDAGCVTFATPVPFVRAPQILLR
jgi:hypothetical protein